MYGFGGKRWFCLKWALCIQHQSLLIRHPRFILIGPGFILNELTPVTANHFSAEMVVLRGLYYCIFFPQDSEMCCAQAIGLSIPVYGPREPPMPMVGGDCTFLPTPLTNTYCQDLFLSSTTACDGSNGCCFFVHTANNRAAHVVMMRPYVSKLTGRRSRPGLPRSLYKKFNS